MPKAYAVARRGVRSRAQAPAEPDRPGPKTGPARTPGLAPAGRGRPAAGPRPAARPRDGRAGFAGPRRGAPAGAVATGAAAAAGPGATTPGAGGGERRFPRRAPLCEVAR